MIPFITNAYNLLQWKDYLQEGQQNSNVNWSGRQIFPITYYVLIGGTLLGTIITVVSAIAQNYLLMSCALFLAFTNCLAACGIKQLNIKRTFNANIQELRQQKQTLNDEATLKKQIREKLETAKKELQQTIEESKQTIVDEKEKYQNTTNQIAKLTTQLQEQQQELSKVLTNSNAFILIVNEFTTAHSTFINAKKMQEESLPQLLGLLKQTHVTEGMLKKENGDFQHISDAMQTIGHQLASIPKSLMEKKALIQKCYEDAQTQYQSIKTQEEQLKSISQQTKETIKQLWIEGGMHKQEIIRLQEMMKKRFPSTAELKKYLTALRFQKQLEAALA